MLNAPVKATPNCKYSTLIGGGRTTTGPGAGGSGATEAGSAAEEAGGDATGGSGIGCAVATEDPEAAAATTAQARTQRVCDRATAHFTVHPVLQNGVPGDFDTFALSVRLTAPSSFA
jgi:hypothetical protein